MNKITVTEYSKNDMLDLNDMSICEVADAIESLDRGYFNFYLFPEDDDDNKVYSEEDYEGYRIRVALQKVYDLLDKEAKGEHEHID